MLQGKEMLTFPNDTAIGALMEYISDPSRVDFQPMNISFGLMPGYLQMGEVEKPKKKMPKKERRLKASAQALSISRELAEAVGY